MLMHMNDQPSDLLQAANAAFLADNRAVAERLAREALACAESLNDEDQTIAAVEQLAYLLMADFSQHREYEQRAEQAVTLKLKRARRKLSEAEARPAPNTLELTAALSQLAHELSVDLLRRKQKGLDAPQVLDKRNAEILSLHHRLEAHLLRAEGEQTEPFAGYLSLKGNHLVRANARSTEGIHCLERSFEILSRLHPPDAKQVIRARRQLVGACFEGGMFDRAEVLLREALAVEPPRLAGSTQQLLAHVLAAQGRTEASLQLGRAEVDRQNQELHEKPWLMAIQLTHLGSQLVDAGRADEAEPLLRRALAALAQSPTDRVIQLAMIHTELSRCLSALGHADEATTQARRAFDLVTADGHDYGLVALRSMLRLADCVTDAAERAEILRGAVERVLGWDPGRVARAIDLCGSLAAVATKAGLTFEVVALEARIASTPPEWKPAE